MGRQHILLDPVAADAVALLGLLVREARVRYGWTQADLAARAGVSARTVSAVESGAGSTSIGAVFNVVVAAGVRLFDFSPLELSSALRRTNDTVVLLPKRIRPKAWPDLNLVNVDF